MRIRYRVALPLALVLLSIGVCIQLSARSGDAAFTCGATPNVLMHGPRLGEVTDSSIKVWARACVQADVSVEYKESGQGWTEALQTAGVPTDAAADNTVVVQVTNLNVDASYDYRLRVGGQLPAKPLGGTFNTLPDDGQTTFIMSSDLHHPYVNGPYGTDLILDLMSSKAADFAFMMGDQIVIEIVLNNLGRCCTPQSQADYELAYQDMSAYAHFRDFAANTPLMATWDDHELLNDWNPSTPNQHIYPWAKNAFDAYFGRLNPDPLASGTQYVYDAGDIEFFVIDTRTYRSPNFAPDGPGKTMLGAEQKQALKDWLLASEARFKMIVSSVMFSDFSGHTVYGESWPAFATERNEIMDFIVDNGISGVVLFSGDEHTGRVFQMNPWGIYEIAPSPLGWKVGSADPPDPQIKFQSNFVRLFGLLTANTAVCPATLRLELIDEFDVLRYSLDLTEADLHSDRDSDGLLNCEEEQAATDPDDPDTDGDHCGDGAELGSNHMSGGERDPLDPWDYFNPTGDGANRIDDILEVVQQYFVDFGNPNYTASTDRTAGPTAWRTGPPDNLQRVDDILQAIQSYFNDCAYVP